jgi:hypothetical protein
VLSLLDPRGDEEPDGDGALGDGFRGEAAAGVPGLEVVPLAGFGSNFWSWSSIVEDPVRVGRGDTIVAGTAGFGTAERGPLLSSSDGGRSFAVGDIDAGVRDDVALVISSLGTLSRGERGGIPFAVLLPARGLLGVSFSTRFPEPRFSNFKAAEETAPDCFLALSFVVGD